MKDKKIVLTKSHFQGISLLDQRFWYLESPHTSLHYHYESYDIKNLEILLINFQFAKKKQQQDKQFKIPKSISDAINFCLM